MRNKSVGVEQKMNTYFLIWIFAGIAIAGFLFGGMLGTNSSVGDQMNKYTSLDITNAKSFSDLFIQSLESWAGVMAVGGAAVILTLGLATGLNLLAILPFALFWMILNLIIFPLGYLDFIQPAELQTVIKAVIFLAELLVFIAFVRSGE